MVVMAVDQACYVATVPMDTMKPYIPRHVERKKNARTIGFGWRLSSSFFSS